MEDLKTLDFEMSMERLSQAATEGQYPDELIAPLHALVSDVVGLQRSGPVSLYICSADTESDLRNYFAFALSKSLGAHVPDTVLIDVDFLAVGLSGIVPHRDGLGFLDLLLYGSSLGAIMQKAAGDVAVVSAGSFPVGKKSPFVMDAFHSSLRYLLNSSSCVVFCGPALDDDDNVHPIVEAVGLPILVRYGRRVRPGIPDPLEDKVSTRKGSKVWSVRVVEPAEGEVTRTARVDPPVGADFEGVLRTAPAHEDEDGEDATRVAVERAEEAQPPPRPVPPPAAERKVRKSSGPTPTPTDAPTAEPIPDEPRAVDGAEKPAHADAGPPPSWKEESGESSDYRSGQRRGSSFFPRAITTVVAVLLIAFLLWWLYVTRSFREPTDNPPAKTPQEIQKSAAQTPNGDDGSSVDLGTQPVDSSRVADASAEDGAGDVETTAGNESDLQTPQQTEDNQTPPPKPVPAPTESTDNIRVVDGVGDFSGRYLVHVSSFRRLENARKDAESLNIRDYGLIIAPVDLGEKGTWYRVYAGPASNAAEAQELKIKLDENPRVKFTRIVRIPG